ncbi:hypothetical protein ACUWEX_01660 [Okibacterium fritillariae]|uniref:hypothetical protein n=1 Tax=Okibacterium fritillariae TaxID=123320 RepID=UPI0040558F9C
MEMKFGGSSSMELSFRTRQLREFCIRPTAGVMHLEDIADLVATLADLMAAGELREIPWGVVVNELDPGEVTISINPGWNIEGRVDHVPQLARHAGLRSTRIRIDELRNRENRR